MKKIILTLLILCIYSMNGQSIIGMNRAQLEKGSRNQPSCDHLEYRAMEDGTGQLIMTIKKSDPNYINHGLNSIIFYLNKGDICISWGHLYSIEGINDGIKSLNDNYVSVGENKWIDYKQDLEINLIKNVAFYLLIYQAKK